MELRFCYFECNVVFNLIQRIVENSIFNFIKCQNLFDGNCNKNEVSNLNYNMLI